MSQSNQAVEQETEQAVGQIVEQAVVTRGLSMLGSRLAVFNFPSNKTSTRTATAPFDPPPGTTAATIAQQDFDVKYSNDKQFGFGTLQISLSTTTSVATCTVTLRDNNKDSRVWQGTVRGVVTFFGTAV